MSQITPPPNKPARRHIPILLFLTAGLPVIFAFFMYFSGSMIPEGRNNKGTLILPTLAIEKLELKLLQAGEGETESKWQMLVFGNNACTARTCQEMLHNTRQVNVALGREAGRVIRRYINIGGELNADAIHSLQAEYPRLHLSQADKAALTVFLDRTVNASDVEEHSYVFIADPLGNVMMYYTPANQGGDLLSDLKALLKISNIG